MPNVPESSNLSGPTPGVLSTWNWGRLPVAEPGAEAEACSLVTYPLVAAGVAAPAAIPPPSAWPRPGRAKVMRSASNFGVSPRGTS